MNKMPDVAQAGVYSSTLHDLQAIARAGTDATSAVMEKMKAIPINDFFARNGHIRGRRADDARDVSRPPQRPSGPRIVATIPTDEPFMPLSRSRCPLAKR